MASQENPHKAVVRQVQAQQPDTSDVRPDLKEFLKNQNPLQQRKSSVNWSYLDPYYRNRTISELFEDPHTKPQEPEQHKG